MRKLSAIVLSVIFACNCLFAGVQAQEEQVPPIPQVAPEGQAQPKPTIEPAATEKKTSEQPTAVLKINKVGNDLFSMELRDVEIGDLLRVLAHDYNLNIIMDKKVKGKITASFSNISLDEALARIVENNNLAYKRIGNVIKVAPCLITKTFVLKYLQAKDVIKPLSAQASASNPSSSTSMPASTTEGSSSQYGQNNSTSASGSSSASQSSVQPSANPVVPPQAGAIGAAEQPKNNTIYDLLSADGKIFFDNEANSIMVIDYPDNVKRIGKYLSRIDTLPRQVLIEARIVEVKLQKEHALGVNWKAFTESGNLPIGSWRLGSASTLGNPPTPLTQSIAYKNTVYPPGSTTGTAEEPFSISIFDKNINIVLKMLTSLLKTDILSAPRVTTVNNREASIEMIQRYPWAEPQVNVQGQSGAMSTSWTVNYEDLGIVLKVTPTINKDGTITMVLDPEVTEKTGDYPLKINQGSTTIEYSVPIIDKRSASTKVVVGNGQTLILGGLIKDTITKGETKVPLMGDLPYIGYLFKSKKETKDKTELLIFVSPTIITRQKAMPSEDFPAINTTAMIVPTTEGKNAAVTMPGENHGSLGLTPVMPSAKKISKPSKIKNKPVNTKPQAPLVLEPQTLPLQANKVKEVLETENKTADKVNSDEKNKKVEKILSLLEEEKNK